MQRKLISNALQERFNELCGVRLLSLRPEEFGEMSDFVSLTQERLRNALVRDIKNSPPGLSAQGIWLESDADCLSALRALCLGQSLPLRPGRQPTPTNSFLDALDASRSDPASRFRLLAQRYSCPLNFTLHDEDEVRERLLRRLMVPDRARLEKNPVAAMKGDDVNSDDLLLRLNLTAVHASLAMDLRFLDALNYYYELLPATWRPHAQHNWLLASYMALYARALAAWILEDDKCE